MALESVAFERLGVDEAESNAFDDDFEVLYRRFYPRLVSTCRRRVADDALAEDIAQETLIRALTHRDAFDRGRPAWPWLKTIATNLIVDHYRKHMRETTLAPDHDGVVEDGPAIEEADLLRRAIQQLPRRQRAAVALRYLNDWDAQDAASFMGVTRPAYEQLLFRARRRLKMEYRRLSQEVSAAVAAGSASLRALSRRAGNRMRELGASAPSFADLTSITGAQIASGAIAFAIAVGGQPLATSPAKPDSAMRAPVAAITRDADAAPARSARKSSAELGRGAGSTGAATAPVAVAHEDDASPARHPLGEMTNDGVSQPEDVHIYSLALAGSPGGSDYAVGRANCLSDTCTSVLFESSDRGATWTRLPAQHLNSESLLVPPGAGADDPIFGIGRVGLQVSRDGGETFTPAAPTGATHTVGSAAISPAFTSGDPTILIGAQTLMRYRDDLGVVEPAPWVTGSGPLQPAFAPQYPVDDRIVVGGLVANEGSGKLTSGVHTCTARVCSYTPVGDMALRVDVRLAPDFAASNVEYAFTPREIHVSSDAGRTFKALSIPWEGGEIVDVAVGVGGRVLAAVRGKQAGVYSSMDGGTTWTVIPYELFAEGASSISMTGDRIMVALAGTGLACSSDGGVTWATRCAAPR